MPAPMKIHITVEQVRVGYVLNWLHHAPGVVKVDIDLGDTKTAKAHAKANGQANTKEDRRKTPFRSEVTGADFLIGILKKGKMQRAKISEHFEKTGRSGNSANSLLHDAKTNGLLELHEDGFYSLTKKGRDRARYI
jgi:4-hydroxyphenylpyruvate dioxygenase-like putative hemolysin